MLSVDQQRNCEGSLCPFNRKKMKKKLAAAWGWLRAHIFNKECLLGALIAETIFWSPCIITGLVAVIYSPWWWTAFWAVIAFWAGPFTPALPLQFGLIVAVNKILKKIKIKKKERKND